MKHELPMRPLSGEVWPTSRSMEDSVRSSFDKRGKDTRHSYVLASLYCGMLFLKLSCMYGIFTPYMYSWIAISSLRKVISAIIWIWILSIRLETQCLRDDKAFNKSTQKNILFAIYTKYISGKYCCQIYIYIYIYIYIFILWYILGDRSSTTLENVFNTKTTILEFIYCNYSTYLNSVDIYGIASMSLKLHHCPCTIHHRYFG
jgi:hypothetical protein